MAEGGALHGSRARAAAGLVPRQSTAAGMGQVGAGLRPARGAWRRRGWSAPGAGLRPAPTTPNRRPAPALVGLALALLLVILPGCSLGGARATATPSATPTPVAPTPVPLRGIATPTGSELKIDTVLLDLVQVYRAEGRQAARARAAAGLVGLALAPRLVVLPGCSPGGARATATPSATPTAGAPTPVSLRGIATPTGSELKIDTVLLDLVQVYRAEGRQAAEQRAREVRLLGKTNDVRLTLVLTDNNTGPVVNKVQSLGGRVVGTHDNLVDISVPLDTLLTYVGSGGDTFLQDLASFNTVRELRVTPSADREGLTYPPGATVAELRAQIARTISEGVAVTGADRWHAAGITGQGIKIGVIDGGFYGYEALLGSGLPARVTARPFNAANALATDESEIHGTAVAEIVHGMAPGADLYLAAIDGPTDLHRAVRWLVDEAQVNVISMSLGWSGLTPGDGTGTFADAVNYAHGKGVLFVKSAGNEGDSHYAGAFTDGDGNGWHEFAPGKETLRVAPADYLRVVLNWDAWSGDPVNLDLYVYAQDGTPVASSRNNQGAGRDPVEIVSYQARPGQAFLIRVQAPSRPVRPVRLMILTKNSELELTDPRGSISTPGDARGSFTVGATLWKNDRLESYSSQGPTVDGRLKPELTAPAGVTSSPYARVGQPFDGTSASAPHVGGAAALAFGAMPGATAERVAEYLQRNAKDLEEPGPDNKTGHGRLQLGDPAQARGGAPAPATPGAPGTPTAGQRGGPSGPAFSDPFANPASGLPNGGDSRYEGGRYRVAPNAANRAVWATYGSSYGDVTVEVTAQIEGAATAGIVFWQSANEEYYLFSISADGSYQVALFQGGRWSSLTPWTKNAAIAATGPNQLKLETRGATITVSANGKVLGTTQAQAPGSGRLGLLAATFAQPGGGATFSELKVTPTP